ncbi:MAG TPA: DHA2 family efflux MFS transporter permease subunit [Candidatus Baltobacteraceae bacterium]|nr:DHA2 family efflux MFS transporter permease subunit [Candidatus Baltobacteraceae bacterium]
MQQAETTVEHGSRLVVIVLGVAIAAVMQFLDSTIVNVALPTIGGNLGASFDEIGWVVTAYSLAAIGVIPLTGWLALRFGRKRYFLFSIVGFTAASALCGLSTSFGALLVSRVIQGLFGGGLVATSQSILVSSFPRERQAVAQGIFALIAVLGPGLGPTVGGWLTDQFSWPLIFFINLPLGIFCVLALVPTLKESRTQRRPVDVLGIVLLVSGLACLQYFLERGEIKQWFDDDGIRACAAWAVIALPWFVVHALRTPHPVLDLRTLRHRNLAFASLATFALGANLFGSLLVLPLYLQNSLGFTALLAGTVLFLRTVPTAILTPLGTFLLQRGIVSARAAAAFGLATLAVGTYLLSAGVTPVSDAGIFVPGMLVVGVAFAFLWTPLGFIALRSLPPPEIGYGAAIWNLSAQVGGSVSIAAITTLQDRRQAFWWDALASRLQLGNHAIQLLPSHDFVRTVVPRLTALVAGQAAVLAYRDLLLLLAVVPLAAIPFVLLTKGRRATA